MIEPGAYIWTTKNLDLVITIMDTLGEGPDGRLYVKIKESDTGIPFDECEKITQES